MRCRAMLCSARTAPVSRNVKMQSTAIIAEVCSASDCSDRCQDGACTRVHVTEHWTKEAYIQHLKWTAVQSHLYKAGVYSNTYGAAPAA